MTRERAFEAEEFDTAFDAALANCTELTRAEAAHFVEHGHVVIKAAFPKEMADFACASAWTELEANYGVERTDPDTWDGVSRGRGRMRGYVRTQGTGARFLLKTHAPRAFAAQADVIGGADRLWEGGKTLSWGDAVVGNLRVPRWPGLAAAGSTPARLAQGRPPLPSLHQLAGAGPADRAHLHGHPPAERRHVHRIRLHRPGGAAACAMPGRGASRRHAGGLPHTGPDRTMLGLRGTDRRGGRCRTGASVHASSGEREPVQPTAVHRQHARRTRRTDVL